MATYNPGEPGFLGKTLLTAAVQRAIFSPYGGEVLDVRRAVLLDGTDHGRGIHVMTAAEFDQIEAAFFERYPRADFDVYDGRKLFK
jgi:hypothetical protein